MLVPLALVAVLGGADAALGASAGHRARVPEDLPDLPLLRPGPDRPRFGRIYPYFRFDGFTDRPVDREWTVVELENEWIRVTVHAGDRGQDLDGRREVHREVVPLRQPVVKFRDVAMRGPWTSGGIEANYGIIGHTPNCATPVDYVTRAEPRRQRLGRDRRPRPPHPHALAARGHGCPADKAYFTTTSLWHNQTPLEQPYYTWMNAGLKAAGNLQFVYPGTHFIGHGGEASPWPIDPKTGRDLSFYERNDFGPSKSYHVLGRESDFWGAFWHDDDFGMGRYSPRDEKLGKKIWIWGLSRQGMIWEKLLTDTDGQYVEVQSGRSFNQAAEESTRTPFKHRGFLPYGTDTWTEYWFPVVGTKGLVAGLAARRPRTCVPREGGLDVLFSPLEAVSETLEVLDGDTRRLPDAGRGEAPRDVDDGRARDGARGAPARPDRGNRLEWIGRPEGRRALRGRSSRRPTSTGTRSTASG